MGGLWDIEVIDGVQLWFPKFNGNKMAIAEVSASRYVEASAVQGKPEPYPGPFVEPKWAANANKILETLGLGVRIGIGAPTVHSLVNANVRSMSFRDGARSFLTFAPRTPDIYHIKGVIHATEGLLKLEIRRPDLIMANEFKDENAGAYKEFQSALFDEGEEG